MRQKMHRVSFYLLKFKRIDFFTENIVKQLSILKSEIMKSLIFCFGLETLFSIKKNVHVRDVK